MGRPAGCMPRCTRRDCPGGATDGKWVLVGPWKGRYTDKRVGGDTPDVALSRSARVGVGLQVAPDPPIQAVTFATVVSEMMRIERAAHEFGVLNVYPSMMGADDIASARDETLALLMGERRGVDVDRWCAARDRVNVAATVLQSDLRSVMARVGHMRGRVTRRTSCPVDVARLRAFLLTTEARDLPRDAHGRVRSDARTLGMIAREFLLEVTGERDGLNGMMTGDNKGSILIEYRYSAVGEALMDAGHISGSREYAKGADPFKLPKRLRNLALARFGFDLDDDGSHPRASAYLIEEGRELAQRFLGVTGGVEHRELVLAAIGARFFPGANLSDRRKRAKQLINMLEMDGSFQDWCVEWGVAPHALRQPPLVVDLPDGTVVNVVALIDGQPTRTTWLTQTCTRAFSYTQQLCRHLPGHDHPDRTLKSYILQEAEAASRAVKIAWAERVGARWLSLQHDGVVMGLPGHMTHQRACASLARECEMALGYRQPVVMKEMIAGVMPDACDSTDVRAEEPRVRVTLRVLPVGKTVCLRVGRAHLARAERHALDDPARDTRRIRGSDGGAGRCVRTRTAQTRAESLRREGARQHEDVRFKVLAGRPLANLRHVIGECPATPQRQQRVAKIAQALGALHDAVPRGHGEVSEYHALTLAARVTLQARDGGALSEQQWEHVDRILSAFLPDIARTHSDAKERRAIIDDVVDALIEVTDRGADGTGVATGDAMGG